MVRIHEKKQREIKRGKLRVRDDLIFDVEKIENIYVIKYNDKVISKFGGDFIEACFEYDKYIICASKEDLEGVVNVN